jgi:hypothetical protein
VVAELSGNHMAPLARARKNLKEQKASTKTVGRTKNRQRQQEIYSRTARPGQPEEKLAVNLRPGKRRLPATAPGWKLDLWPNSKDWTPVPRPEEEKPKPKSLRFEEPTKGEMSWTSNTSQKSIFSLNSNKIHMKHGV